MGRTGAIHDGRTVRTHLPAFRARATQSGSRFGAVRVAFTSPCGPHYLVTRADELVKCRPPEFAYFPKPNRAPVRRMGKGYNAFRPGVFNSYEQPYQVCRGERFHV